MPSVREIIERARAIGRVQRALAQPDPPVPVQAVPVALAPNTGDILSAAAAVCMARTGRAPPGMDRASWDAACAVCAADMEALEVTMGEGPIQAGGGRAP